MQVWENALVVLIDDDSLVHMTWQLAARQKNVNLQVYFRVQDFFEKMTSYALETLIYVDSSLGEGVQGEEAARTLYQKGFRNLYMTTGFPPSRFQHLTWLKGVVGKEPPWIDFNS